MPIITKDVMKYKAYLKENNENSNKTKDYKE